MPWPSKTARKTVEATEENSRVRVLLLGNIPDRVQKLGKVLEMGFPERSTSDQLAVLVAGKF